jgi:hypothetical protein
MTCRRADLSALNAKLTDDEKVRIIHAVGQRDITAIIVAFFLGASVAALVLLGLGGCANAPPPTSTTSHSAPSDPLADALGRIVSRTGQQATGMGGSTASREVITSTGGSFGGQVGGAFVRNVTSEAQRWWSAR